MLETTIIPVSIASFSGVAAVVFGFLGFLRSRRHDSLNDGEHAGAVMTELGYIKSGIDDIKHRQDRQEARYTAVIERLAVVEESLHQAHHRIDELT